MRRPPRPLLAPLAALAGLLVLGSAIRAEDEPPDPAARTKSVAAAFPAPSVEKGFEWSLVVIHDGAALGRFDLAVRPHAEGSTDWIVAEAASMTVGEDSMSMQEEVVAGRDLLGRSGRKEETHGALTRVSEWERTETGYRISVKDGEEEAKEVSVESPGALVGVASALLFCRLAPAEKATYAVPLLNPTEKDSKWIREGRIEVLGPVTWEWAGIEAEGWRARIVGDATVIATFSAKTRDLLGLEIEGTDLSMRHPVDLESPAKSPQIAALRAAYAITLADSEMLGEVVDWTSAYARAKAAGDPDSAGTMEEYRAAKVAALKPQVDAQQAVVGFTASASQLKIEKMEDGVVRVTFPEKYKGLHFDVREADTAWKLAVWQ